MNAITPDQMVNMPPEVAGMMLDDGGMSLGGALDPGLGNVAPRSSSDALSGAMDQVADQGAGGGAPDMGVPADGAMLQWTIRTHQIQMRHLMR